jgi:hypothetical protein
VLTGRRRWVVIVAGAVVALAFAVVGIVVATRPSPSYGPADQDKFTAACTAAGGEPARPTCACIWTEMTQKVAYADYVSIDADLGQQRATGQPLRFPPTVDSIRAACLAAPGPK